MEKLPEFNAEEDIEEWLEVFECRAACAKITNEKTKNSVVSECDWKRW